MMEVAGAPLPVALDGVVGGIALGGDGTLQVLDDGIRIDAPTGEITVAAIGLDGVTYRDSRLTLFLRHGDVIDATGTPRLAAMARQIVSQVCTVPELTRPLRALGSRRGEPGSDHDRFFGPLLAARRKGERANDPRPRLRAFDATAIEKSLDQTIEELARVRYPKRAPERRALEAELLEIAIPLRTALDTLRETSRRALDESASGESAFVRWRSWCTAVETVFERADRCWLAFVPVLRATPPRHRPLWRRMLRLGVLVVGTIGYEMALESRASNRELAYPAVWEGSYIFSQ
jgi:hypothetical protein